MTLTRCRSNLPAGKRRHSTKASTGDWRSRRGATRAPSPRRISQTKPPALNQDSAAAGVAAVTARIARVAAVGAAVRAALQEADVVVAFRLLAAVLHFAAAAGGKRVALRVANAAARGAAAAAIRQAAVQI